jgi:hypothetical protein
MCLGAPQHKEPFPMRELARWRQSHIDEAELEGIPNPESKVRKKKASKKK